LTLLGATLGLALPLSLAARAEIIDRIAVSVGNSVITTSDIDTAARVTALFNGAPLDFTPATKRVTADRLVKQKLIQKELEESKYPVPDAAAAAPQWEDFRKTHTEQQIAAYGLTDQEIKDALLWQLTLLRFIEVRFRPSVQVSDEDIQDYFEKVVKPAAEASGDPASLDDYRAKIATTLTGERTDQEVDNWLKEARQRTQIVYHEEVFQ
jgi:hypothetical protein